MKRTAWIPRALTLALAMSLVTGCSKEDKGGGSCGSGGGAKSTRDDAANKAAENAKKEKAAADRKQKLEELKEKRDSLMEKYATSKAAIPELEKKHEKEQESAPDLRKLQGTYVQLRQDAARAASVLRTMEREFESVKGAADKLATDEIKALRSELSGYEKAYDKAMSSWRKAADEADQGKVEESPVKRDLDAIRNVKVEWFKATPKARAGLAGGDKSSINARFRAWLEKDRYRVKVVNDVLKLPTAPKGKSVTDFDFTDLRFYLLLEIHEADLDRKNVVEELKGLTENISKADAIMAKADGVREKIAQLEQAGGGDLEIYSDLKARLPGQRLKVTDLEASISAMSAVFGAQQAASERRDKEMDEAIQLRDGLKKDIAKLIREIRSLGG